MENIIDRAKVHSKYQFPIGDMLRNHGIVIKDIFDYKDKAKEATGLKKRYHSLNWCLTSLGQPFTVVTYYVLKVSFKLRSSSTLYPNKLPMFFSLQNETVSPACASTIVKLSR